MRRIARAALAIGALGSLVLMFIHGRHNQHVLVTLLFVGWVLAPFLGLAWIDTRATTWPEGPRKLAYGMTVFVSLGSLAIYAYDVASGYGRAVLFVLVPGVSFLVILASLTIAVVAVRRSTPRV